MLIVLLSSWVSYKFGERSGRAVLSDGTHEEKLPSSFKQEVRGPLDDQSHMSSSTLLSCPPLECPPCEAKCECDEPPPPPKKKRRRPPLPKKSSPVDRQKLLAWVKRYSPRLKRCRDAGQPIYRLHAEAKLNASKNKILSAKVRGTDVPSSALRCVESDIRRWPAPRDLTETHPRALIFSLQLN